VPGRRHVVDTDQFDLRDRRRGMAEFRAERVLGARGLRRGRVGPHVRGPPAVRGQEQPVHRPRAQRVRLPADRPMGG